MRVRSGLAVIAALAMAGWIAVLPLASPATAAPRYTPISGSGSTWSANAISQWISDVSQSGMAVSYSGTGSSTGRRDFAQYQNDFAVSEIPFQGKDPLTGSADDSAGRGYAYMPIVAGGTAFMYHIRVNGQLYRDLRLSGETIAKIFTGAITHWNDKDITRDNNGVALPAKRIVPVVRSDGSGTTAQFTLWMDKQHRDILCQLRCGMTSYYQTFGNAVAQSGSKEMATYISASYGDGTIGYVEYSYARNKNFPVAKVRNAANYYVEPTQFNVAVALTKARINTDKNSPEYLTQILDDVYRSPDPRTYPLSSYSYMIVPTSAEDRRVNAANGKGRTLSAFSQYFLCQGQQKAGDLGFSPLPLNLVRAGFEQVAKIPGAESGALRPEGCDNPTFDPANPENNRLAKIAEQPPACAKEGQGPCTGPDGKSNPAKKGPAGKAAPGGDSAQAANTGQQVAGPAGPAAVDPVTGEALATDEVDDAAGKGGGAIEVAASPAGLANSLGALAAGQVLLLMLIPLFLGRSLSRRRGQPDNDNGGR